MSQNSPFTDILTTLLTNGFNIFKVDRFPLCNNIVHAYKYDKLGAKVKYSILFTSDISDSPLVDTLIRRSKELNTTPLIVGDSIACDSCKIYSKKDFFALFGGIVSTGLILVPHLPGLLNELGHNKLPDGLKGKPDNLHEIYIKECLQFIMESPTRRYGIDRSFESVPDAVVLSKEGFILLIDSKAYGHGFNFQADDIKRFASYIEDFRHRYSPFYGNILSFLVITGNFNDSEKAIRSRSDELYKLTNCKLSSISSIELGRITNKLKDDEVVRKAICWKNIFSETIVNTQLVELEIKRVNKDNIL